MKITFNIDYHTNWGESLYITGDVPELGSGDKSKAIRLTPYGNTHRTTIDIAQAKAAIHYRYFLKREDGTERNEWGDDRTLRFDPRLTGASIIDRWHVLPWNKPYYSSAFTDCICRHAPQAPAYTTPGMLQFVVEAPMILPGQILAIAGSCPELGDWDPAMSPVMNHSDFPVWKVEIPIAGLPREIEYKFVVLEESTRKVLGWERGDNRRLLLPDTDGYESLVVAGLFFENPMPLWRGSGVAIPVFSLRSEQDFGVGDFYDLMPMVDWAESTGQKFIQLLPVNDTTMSGTWTDSYPYNANSTFALHPMYLRLQAMGELRDRKRQSHFDALARELNSLPEVDYERVNKAKNEFTRELFNEQGAETLNSPDFADFVKANESWLLPYAAFCVLRDRYRTADPSAWEEYAVYDAARIAAFISINRHDIDYVLYIQYHLHCQMKHVRDYAHSHGVALKGDIPIGISRHSVDAWTNPELFNLGCSAGAPPDDFSVLGQNWGFPTYNWEVMSRDGFAWWKARFRKMAEYFDAYRIDHVLGFFRIWQIPLDAVHGLLGVFNPALPMTPEEMRGRYGFDFEPGIFTEPFVMDYMLTDFFGDLTQEVCATFLDKAGYGRYRLKSAFATQRQVADYFATMSDDDRNTRLCNGLLGLIDDVLFIEDPYEKGKYHPRIAAQYTYVYRSLSDHQRWCFDRLYNDFYYHRHNDFWREKAMWKLPPLIDSTSMLVCAEDLGMIPACVPSVMSELEILSLEIQRMPKNPAEKFGNTHNYPYLSVCTTSTHDMGGIRQWWEENREATQRYFNDVLCRQGEAPFYAEPWICRDILNLNLKSPSMLCILPLQDWMSSYGALRRQDPHEEQINVPANPRHYWRYRMHITLEQLKANDDFNASIRRMVEDSGR